VSAHVLDRLSLYLDGELAPAARSEVESHLRGCAACARHLEELAAVDAAARELPVPAPAGYFDSLPARVRARLPPPRRRSPPVWVWAAAAGIAIAALVPSLFQRTATPVPEAARIQEPAPAAPAIAPGAPAREEARVEAPADVPAARLAREKTAMKDQGSIKLKAVPAGAAPAAATPAPLPARAAENAAAPPPPAPQVQKHSGPWAQAPAGAPAPAPQPLGTSDESMAEARAPKEIQLPAGAEAKTEREQDRRRGLPDAVATFAQAPTEETRYRALLARRTESAGEDRLLHDQWRAFAASYPAGAHADEARVRALDALLSAYRREGEARDRERLREEAGLYLQRADAAQAGRVRAILEAAGMQP
jgi:Putative zinc-finger